MSDLINLADGLTASGKWRDVIDKECLPSAESKTAVTDSLIHDYFECPYCGLIADKDERPTWMYCPSCGVKMPEILADLESEDKE